MEKLRPSYDLDAIRRVMGSVETIAMTRTALSNAAMLGFELQDVADVIATITQTMFVKSMTTYADHRTWQDVYHVPAKAFVLYVKFQSDAVCEFKVMSFKER